MFGLSGGQCSAVGEAKERLVAPRGAYISSREGSCRKTAFCASRDNYIGRIRGFSGCGIHENGYLATPTCCPSVNPMVVLNERFCPGIELAIRLGECSLTVSRS